MLGTLSAATIYGALGSVIVDGKMILLYKTETGYEMVVQDGTSQQKVEWHDGVNGRDGQDGAVGNGIGNVVLNDDYTLTINFTDGTSYTTPVSIRGEKGDKGEKGADGIGQKGETGSPGRDGVDGADGVGIAYVSFNPNTSITLNLTDGSSVTTEPLKGERGSQGEAGRGIYDAAFDDNDKLTLAFTDGTTVTSKSLKGEKGDRGEKGETGAVTSIVDMWVDDMGVLYCSVAPESGINFEVNNGVLEVSY